MEITRENVIKYGIEHGKSVKDINSALTKANLEQFNPVVDIGRNVARNARDFARDFATTTGAIVKPIMEAGDEIYRAPLGQKQQAVRDAFNKTIQNKMLQRTAAGAAIGGTAGSFIPGVGTAAGIALGSITGLVGGPKNLADAFLSTYGTSIDDIKSGNVDINKIKYGIYSNPLYAGMDVLGVPGVAKYAGKAGGAIGKAVPKTAPMAVQQLLPSPELRNFNRLLTESMEGSKSRHADLYKSVNTLETMPLANREEIVKNITMNTGNLNEGERVIAEAIKKDLRANESKAIELGLLDKASSKTNTIAQYVMGKVGNKVPGLLHMDIVDLLEGRELRPTAKNLIGDGKEILQAIEDGNKLYGEGKISFLTQMLAGTADVTGEIKARNFNKEAKNYFQTSRITGKTEADRLADVLDESIKFQLAQVGKPTQVIDLIDNIIRENKLGQSVLKEGKVPEGKYALNKDAFQKSIRESIANTGEANIQKALRDSNIAMPGSVLVDEIYGKAIQNAFTPSRMGKLKKLTNSFKKAVLANPHWVMLNRIGNFTNNAMGGVTLKDYVDTKRLSHLLPNKLKQQTAFASYVGEGIESINQPGWKAVWGQPLSRISKASKKFAKSSKSLEDIGTFAGELYGGTSDLTANPMFRLESTLERTDRFANFIKQAREYGKANNMSLEQVLKKANLNEQLFDKLNRQVNKDLGDYIGRNYAVPQGVYDVVSEAVPFYRFLTQTGRTTAHQLANHPIAFGSMVNVPARVGSQASKKVIQEYNLDPEQYEGGAPYKVTPWGEVRTLGIEPLPAQAVARDIANLLSGKEMGSLASPYLTMVSDILNYKKGDRIPTSKALTELKMTRPSEAEKYKPTQGERLRYALNQIISTTYNPYRWTQSYIPEAAKALWGIKHGNVGLQSRYDIEQFTENPLSYRKTTPAELIGRWAALQTRGYYPQFKQRMSKKEMKKALRNRKKAEMKSKYKGE